MEHPERARLNTQIYEEACEWFIECRVGDLGEIARAEFDRWLRKSPEHQSAYLEIAAIWNEGPTLDAANRWDVDTLVAQAAQDSGNIVALAPTRKPTGHAPQPTLARKATAAPVAPVGRRRSFAAAALLLLVTVTIVAYLLAPRGVYATVLGEQRSLALSDGSTVQLNSLSKIRIRYTEHERIVDLLQGQALFHVAKDSARPFVVNSGLTRVRAVGTQFDVYRKTNDTIITVVEGRVAILGVPESLAADETAHLPIRSRRGEKQGLARPRDEVKSTDRGPDMLQSGAHSEVDSASPGPGAALPDAAGAILLAAGEQITVTPEAAHRTPHANLAGAIAWTQRQLVFDSASLTEVADEFNRYNERKLTIDAYAFSALHISGVFSSTDPASLIRFLRDRPGVRVTETPTEIRVEKELQKNIFTKR